jgi:hypothetical protein
MELEVTARDDAARGSRVGSGPGGAWAVAGDWDVTASWEGGRVQARSREALAGALRFDGGRLWVGGQALDLRSQAWEPLPPLQPAVTPAGTADAALRDTAWLDAGRLAVAAARQQPPRRKGSGGAWEPWERIVLLEAESRAVEAVLAHGGRGPRVTRLAAAAGTLVAGGDGVRAWRDPAADPAWLIELESPPVGALAISADGLVVAAAPTGRDVLLRSPEGDFRRELAGTAGATALAFHPREPVVAVGRRESVELRSLDGEVLGGAPTERRVVDVAFAADGEQLLVLVPTGLIVLSL